MAKEKKKWDKGRRELVVVIATIVFKIKKKKKLISNEEKMGGNRRDFDIVIVKERGKKGKEIQETSRHEIRMEKKINYMVEKMIHMHGERKKKHCKKSQEYHFYINKRGREGKQNPINF
jgi:hypothetical protein